MTRNKERSQTLYAFVSIWPNYRMWVIPSLQKAIWLSSTSPPAPRKQNRCQPGQGTLPRELSTVQEAREAQLLLQMRPLVRVGQTAREVQFSLHESGIGNTVPGASAGRCKHPNPAHSRWSHPLVDCILQLCNCFIISKRKLWKRKLNCSYW